MRKYSWGSHQTFKLKTGLNCTSYSKQIIIPVTDLIGDMRHTL